MFGPWEASLRSYFDHNMRHNACLVRGDTLYVVWSRVGDIPESLLISKMDISNPDWEEWKATEPIKILEPEKEWEGSKLPSVSSLRGELSLERRELRDPCLFWDSEKDKVYLYYVGRGEKEIGVCSADL